MKIEVPELINPEKFELVYDDEAFGTYSVPAIYFLEKEVSRADGAGLLSEAEYESLHDEVVNLDHDTGVRLARSYRAAWGLHIGSNTPLKPLLEDLLKYVQIELDSQTSDHASLAGSLADRLEMFLFENHKDVE